MNTRIKKLVNELGDAINHSLSNSEQVAHAVTRIKEEGFDIFLVLEATVGLRNRDAGEDPASVEVVTSGNHRNEPAFSVTASDLRFLKSMRISVDDAA